MKEAIAIRFDRTLDVGRNKPMLLACEIEGRTVEVVAKFAHRCERGKTALVAEGIAAMLAADLDLPLPEPFVVGLDPELQNLLVDVIAGWPQGKVLRAFGLARLPSGFGTIPVGRGVSAGLLIAAAEILAFDVIVNNCDRLPRNPNCMFDGQSLAIFDHELAFPTGVLGWRPPWEQGALNDVIQGPGKHLSAVRRGVAARMAGTECRAFAYAGTPQDDAKPYCRDWLPHPGGVVMKHKYSYVVLRYVHDILAGEQLNVGVVLFSPQAGYLGALCRPTYSRLARAFPGLRGDSFRATTRYVQSEIERLAERLSGAPGASVKSILDVATQVLPRDESSFQWSAPAFGVADDLPQTLEDLYERLVTRCDDKEPQERRTDEDVWRRYKRDLESRHLLQHLQPKTITTKDDEIEFQHAWKNGAWHCLEPVSFDLLRADSIREKAHKILGELTSLRDATEPFKVYLLVGAPQAAGMADEYDKALSILDKAPTSTEVVTEQGAAAFLETFAKLIEVSGTEGH